MAGASLMPEYYTSKMHLCIFFSPPASLQNNPSRILENLARPSILNGIVDVL